MPNRGNVAVGPIALFARQTAFPTMLARAQQPHSEASVQIWRDAVGAPFLYTAANWSGVSFYLEVYMRSTSAKALARLYSVTLGAAVSGSELADDYATDGLTTYTRQRTGALTLVDGHEYRVQYGVQDGGAGGAISARLIAR